MACSETPSIHFNPPTRLLVHNSRLINGISGRLVKNDEMQGARNLRNEAYSRCAVKTPVCVGRTGRQDRHAKGVTQIAFFNSLIKKADTP